MDIALRLEAFSIAGVQCKAYGLRLCDVTNNQYTGVAKTYLQETLNLKKTTGELIFKKLRTFFSGSGDVFV